MALCGNQDAFRSQARILKRLVQQYGAEEVGRMIEGARHLGWRSLRSLGSKEGLGRRMAVAAFWNRTKQGPSQLETVAALLKRKGF